MKPGAGRDNPEGRRRAGMSRGHAMTLTVACVLAFLAPKAFAAPIITEFMASNSGSLQDEDGDSPDWIELHNPGADSVSLAGWFLTDDARNPRKWSFPKVTLGPGEYLIVFASGKNRTDPAKPLHANFSLSADGERLALIAPDGITASSVFDFPPQAPDISFGIPIGGGANLLADAPIEALAPASASELPPDWAAPTAADPEPLGQALAGFPVGFDLEIGGIGDPVNLAPAGIASQSSTLAAFGPELAIDGSFDSFTHTHTDDNESSWRLDLPETAEIQRVILHNRVGCCGSRLRDITITLLRDDGAVAWKSDLLNPENVLNSPPFLEVNFDDLNLARVPARSIVVSRTPDPDLSGSGGDGNADEDNVLSLGEVEVFGVKSQSYAPLIRSDVAALTGLGSSLFLRVPFQVEGDAAPAGAFLSIRHDDGVAIYLDGERVASINAPNDLAWDSIALSKRPKEAALQPAIVNLDPDLLTPGPHWLAIHALNASASDPDLFVDVQLIAQTSPAVGATFLDAPTPGAPNLVGWNLGQVADTKFSVNRGFHDEPFDVEITTDTPDAEIRFTRDGSAPTATHGEVYSGPIRIDRSTILRAAAFKPNYRPANVDTHTYIFLDSIPSQPANPPGFPAAWADVQADYAMDPRIARHPDYAPRMREALLSLPAISIVTDVDNLFSATRGIYANPERSGVEWERPVSLEWIDPSGRQFQADCGLRVQGGYFRNRHATQKHSLRVLFKRQYGPGKLREDIFGEPDAAREFDTLVLRAGANDGYSWDAAIGTEQFIRDEFGRRLHLAMGHPSPRGTFVHLYLNGLYWGLYNLTERPAEDFSATYLGGDPETWDAVNSGEVKNGSLEAWDRFVAAARTARTLADYQRLRGLTPEGIRNPEFPVRLDANNYIDYMLVNMWGGNWDWPFKNFWFGRDQTGAVGGFRFYIWDYENTMGNNRARSPLNMVSPQPGTEDAGVGAPHNRLRNIEEYRVAFADRVHRHFFDNGVLTPSNLLARYAELAERVRLAILPESARWGDDHHNPPQDPSDWERELDWIRSTYLPQRSAIVLQQFRAANLYPSVSAPVFLPSQSAPDDPGALLITAQAPELYYTTNGADPRLPGGAIHPDATFVASDPDRSAILASAELRLAQPVTVLARSRENGAWSALAERRVAAQSVPATAARLVISEIHYRPAAPATAAELAVSSEAADFEFVELLNISPSTLDLSGLHFTEGIEFSFPQGTLLSPGERVLVASLRAAFESRYGPTPRLAGEYLGRLDNAGEAVALANAQGVILHRVLYGNAAPWPNPADAPGHSLTLIRPADGSPLDIPQRWRWSSAPGGTPGETDATAFTGHPNADTNENGVPDLVDYALGNLPSNARLAARMEGAPEGPVLWLDHPQAIAAEDVQLILEFAPSLEGPWTVPSSLAASNPRPLIAPGVVRISHRLNLDPADNPQLFIRLSARLNGSP
jgi:hypothetical protein